MVDEDGVVGREPNIGEFILVLCDVCAVCADALDTPWRALTLEEACICVLGPRIDIFGAYGLYDVVNCHVLEVFVVARGFDYVGFPDVAQEEAVDEVHNALLNAHFRAGCGRIPVVGKLYLPC